MTHDKAKNRQLGNKNPYPWEQSDLGPYHLQYRLQKNVSKEREGTTEAMTGRAKGYG